VLQQLNKLLIKYQSLGSTRQRTWDRLKWGKENLQEMREKILTHTSSLNLFLATLGTGSLGRIEKKLDQLIEDVRAGRKQDTVVTFALEDDDADEADVHWSEFKNELVDDGFSKLEVESHKNWIKAKLSELLESGVLEEQPAVDEKRIQNGLNVPAPKPRISYVSSRQPIVSPRNPKPTRFQATVEDDDEEVEEKERESYKSSQQTKSHEVPEDKNFEVELKNSEKRGRDAEENVEEDNYFSEASDHTDSTVEPSIAPQDSISQIGVEKSLSQTHVSNAAAKETDMDRKRVARLDQAARYVQAQKKPDEDGYQNVSASAPNTPSPSMQKHSQSETEYLKTPEPSETQNQRSKGVHRVHYVPTSYRNDSSGHSVHQAVPYTDEYSRIINEDPTDGFTNEEDSPGIPASRNKRYTTLRQPLHVDYNRRLTDAELYSRPETGHISHNGRTHRSRRSHRASHITDKTDATSPNYFPAIQGHEQTKQIPDVIPKNEAGRGEPLSFSNLDGRKRPSDVNGNASPRDNVEENIPQKKSEEEVSTVEKLLELTLEELFHGCTKMIRVERETWNGRGRLIKGQQILEIPVKRGRKNGHKFKYPRFEVSKNGLAKDLHLILEEVS
jgi:hypothetical protein